MRVEQRVRLWLWSLSRQHQKLVFFLMRSFSALPHQQAHSHMETFAKTPAKRINSKFSTPQTKWTNTTDEGHIENLQAKGLELCIADKETATKIKPAI